MSDDDPETSDNARPIPAATDGETARGAFRNRTILRIGTLALLLLCAAASCALAWPKLRQFPTPTLGLLAVLTTLGWTALLMVTSWRHQRRWEDPLRDLTATLGRITVGNAPIDDLSHVPGPLAPLAESIHSLVRDLRRQKTELNRLERETTQRVAQRTDALERTIASLRNQAHRDPLTGLYNRRMLDQHLPALVERSSRSGAALGLLMLDLDHFKLLNDTFGHAAGDEFLRSVGQLIRSSLRTDDLAFRYGGDEFAVVMPGASEEVGRRLARRLTSLVEGVAKTIRLPRPLGLSCGVATLDSADLATARALLSAADQDLYQAKAVRKLRSEKPATFRPIASVSGN